MALTLGNILTKADPNLISDALRKVNLGVLLTKQVETLTGVANTVVLSKPAYSGCSVICHVSAGAVGAGVYVCGSTGTAIPAVEGASLGFARLDTDGKTLIFAGGVITATVEYMAASEVPLSDPFNDFV